MIDNDAVIQLEENQEMFFNEVTGWAHQCWQLHILGKDIDLDEFKRRMNSDNIDYKQFMMDHSDKLIDGSNEKIYILRVLHVLYPEEYADPDKE